MDSHIRAQENLRKLTKETWSRRGSLFVAGPLTSAHATSVIEDLSHFEIAFEKVQGPRGFSLQVATSESATINAIPASERRAYHGLGR